MAQIFISHAGANNAQARALGQWLKREGWGDHFLAIDGGFKPGEEWIPALLRESHRCEVVLLLLSEAWKESKFCFAEYLVAKGLKKDVIGVVVEPFSEPEGVVIDEAQRCYLTGDEDVEVFHVVHRSVPATDVPFSKAGLVALADGLRHKDLHATTFRFDPTANPYPGLKAFDEREAAVFFGRNDEGDHILGLLRGDRTRPGAQLFVINGASGVGKSSLLRAGLLPKLQQERSAFIVLPVIRPGLAAISGDSGLLVSLQLALKEQGFDSTCEDIEADVSRTGLGGVLRKLQSGASPRGRQRTVVIAIDQAEELSDVDAAQESRELTRLLGDIPPDSTPVIVLMTTRLESMAAMDIDTVLGRLELKEHRLRPIPPWNLRDAIEEPALLHKRIAERPVEINKEVVDALLTDLKDQPDALPLMALVLNRLFEQAVNTRASEINLNHYKGFGGIGRAIDQVVSSALVAPNADPLNRTEYAQLLETVFPLLSIYDVQTKAWRRRMAPAYAFAKLPPQARALVTRLVNERLLVKDGSGGVEAAHEAVMRHWTDWSRWQQRSVKKMTTIERVHRAAIDWKDGERRKSLLVHTGQERRDAADLQRNKAFKSRFDTDDLSYLGYCRRRDFARQGLRWAIAAAAVPVVWSLWWTRQNDFPLDYAVLPFKWSAARMLQRADQHLPPTVELKPGTFEMGCRVGRDDVEGVECQPGDAAIVRVEAPCAMGSREVTFLEYDYYVWSSGPADSPDGLVPSYPEDSGFGRMDRPVINVTWNNAQNYVRWLSNKTGQNWRLPTDKEWEYAARAGTQTAYHWGSSIGKGHAKCAECGQLPGDPPVEAGTAPVGSYSANGWKIHDTAGNVSEWVADQAEEGKSDRVLRGGSWNDGADFVRSAHRSDNLPSLRSNVVGFRVCLDPPARAPAQSLAPEAKQAKRP